MTTKRELLELIKDVGDDEEIALYIESDDDEESDEVIPFPIHRLEEIEDETGSETMYVLVSELGSDDDDEDEDDDDEDEDEDEDSDEDIEEDEED